MYYTLPVKDRMQLMKHYKNAYPDMDYHDMVKHFSDGGLINTKTKLDKPIHQYNKNPNIIGGPKGLINSNPFGKGEFKSFGLLSNVDDLLDVVDLFNTPPIKEDYINPLVTQRDKTTNQQYAPHKEIQPTIPKFNLADGGKVTPYKPTSQEDYKFRTKMYNDSLDLYDKSLKQYIHIKSLNNDATRGLTPVYNKGYKNELINLANKKNIKNTTFYTYDKEDLKNNNESVDNKLQGDWINPNIAPTLQYFTGQSVNYVYKKPVQQILPPSKPNNDNIDYKSKLNISKEYIKKYPNKPGYITRPATKEELDKGIVAVDVPNPSYQEFIKTANSDVDTIQKTIPSSPVDYQTGKKTDYYTMIKKLGLQDTESTAKVMKSNYNITKPK